MKARTIIMVSAVIVAASCACVHFIQDRPELLMGIKIPATLWNGYHDMKFRFFAPSQTLTGTIKSIGPASGSLTLLVKSARQIPIAIDPEQQKSFRNLAVDVGDIVTVQIKPRISSSRVFNEYYLEHIQLVSTAFRRVPSPRMLSDFALPVDFSISRESRLPISDSGVLQN
jgi:hypothetical protein